MTRPPEFIKRLTHEEIEEGQMLPTTWYYGYAYEEWERHVQVFAVIPLNYLMRFRMWLSLRWDRFRSRPSWMDREIHRQKRIAYREGVDAGRAESLRLFNEYLDRKKIK